MICPEGFEKLRKPDIRFAWENFMGVQKSEKMPKFNQKSTILKIFELLKCYFRVMAISKCLINENLKITWVVFTKQEN